MSYTITPVLKKKYSTDNFGIINLRITQNRKSKYKSLKISIPERFWNNNKNEVRTSYPDNEKINNLIKDNIEKLNKLNISINNNTLYLTNDKVSFIQYVNDHLNKLERQGDLGNHKRYKTTLNHLINFKEEKNKNDILFIDINYEWIQDFDEYLSLIPLKKNTRNNYLKCCQKLFKLSLREGKFKTIENPFNYFQFKNERVVKKRMSFDHLQRLIKQDIPLNSSIEETRNRFLLQVYGQGIRVSDLFTLRFSNIFFDGCLSRINFYQFKTKKHHSIQLSNDLLKHIFYYFDRKKFYEMYNTRKYSITHNGKKYKDTLPKIYKFSKKIKPYKDGFENKILELFSRKVFEIHSNLFEEQLKLMFDYSLENPNKFLLPVLPNDLFSDVSFDDNTKLTKKQYNLLQSKTSVYNKQLKKLNSLCGYSEIITTHTPRHTYTNLLLNTSNDVYSISKSLGHSNLSTTESYLSDFERGKVDDDNIKVFRIMSLGLMNSIEVS